MIRRCALALLELLWSGGVGMLVAFAVSTPLPRVRSSVPSVLVLAVTLPPMSHAA